MPLSGGPLSVLICSGNPYVVNILSTCGTTATALVLFTNSTSGYLEYSSTMTITCSPLGSGPQRSISSSAKVSQVEDSVSGGICLGCKWWLGRRDILQPSSQPSCPGRGTIIWIVVAACVSRRLLDRGMNSASGITSLSPCRIVPCASESSWKTCLYGLSSGSLPVYPFCMALISFCIVGSCSVAGWIIGNMTVSGKSSVTIFYAEFIIHVDYHVFQLLCWVGFQGQRMPWLVVTWVLLPGQVFHLILESLNLQPVKFHSSIVLATATV